MVVDGTVRELGIGFVDDKHADNREDVVGAMPHGFETLDGVVRDGDHAEVWPIGLDVRHLSLVPDRQGGS